MENTQPAAKSSKTGNINDLLSYEVNSVYSGATIGTKTSPGHLIDPLALFIKQLYQVNPAIGNYFVGELARNIAPYAAGKHSGMQGDGTQDYGSNFVGSTYGNDRPYQGLAPASYRTDKTDDLTKRLGKHYRN